MAASFRARADGIELFVRLTPRAGIDALDGVQSGADGRARLAARVRALPAQGAANTALEALLAKAFGVPKRAVTVTAGATSRLKTVRISGDAARLEAAAAALAGPAQPG